MTIAIGEGNEATTPVASGEVKEATLQLKEIKERLVHCVRGITQGLSVVEQMERALSVDNRGIMLVNALGDQMLSLEFNPKHQLGMVKELSIVGSSSGTPFRPEFLH